MRELNTAQKEIDGIGKLKNKNADADFPGNARFSRKNRQRGESIGDPDHCGQTPSGIASISPSAASNSSTGADTPNR
ncbi:MAG: hypothetical protein ACE5NJ_09705 [Thermodesulfobacteriota bacterium]